MTKEEKQKAFFETANKNKANTNLLKDLIEKNLCFGNKMYYDDLKVFAERQVIDNMLLIKLMEFAEEYANLRLSEQQTKHEQEMKEFLDWTYKNGWRHSVTPNFFIRVEYPDIVEERVTFTELLTKFKNRLSGN